MHEHYLVDFDKLWYARGVLVCSDHELQFNYTVCYSCWLVL